MAAKKAVKKKRIGSSRKGARKRETAEDKVDVKVGGKEIESLLAGNMPPVRDLMYHMDTIAGWMDKARTAQGKVSDAKKKAKEAGVDVSAIMTVMKMRRMDPLDLATELRQQAALMREADLPIQLSLMEPTFGTIEEQASAEGWTAGKAGRTPDTTRWPEGAPGHVEYMRRWNDGQKDTLEKGAGTEKEAEGEEE
jgi:hypothetical protein